MLLLSPMETCTKQTDNEEGKCVPREKATNPTPCGDFATGRVTRAVVRADARVHAPLPLLAW